MHEYLIECSQHDTGRDIAWTDETFDTIAWTHLGLALRKLAPGQ
jgi:hypothetical protein